MPRLAQLAVLAALAASSPLAGAQAVEHRSTDRNQPIKNDTAPCRTVDRSPPTQAMPANAENARHGENRPGVTDCAAAAPAGPKDTKSTGARRHTD